MILRLLPDGPTLPLRVEPQLSYALLSISPPAGAGPGRPVNWALVADASRSMRIPIVSEEQFRDLVRGGGAQEVLVDGVPVWQLTTPVPDEVKASAPSAIDYVARALHSVVERLGSGDRFTLIACAEDAVLLTPATSGADRGVLVQSIGRLKGLRLGEETDLAEGMRLGMAQLGHGRGAGDLPAARSDRMLLLTDGFTRRPDECLALARQAAIEGITISTLGLGGEFQDDLLTKVADTSGGRAVFLRRPDAIPRAVAEELAAARAVVARTATLAIKLIGGAALHRVTRISPALAPLDYVATPPSHTVYLGDLESDTPVLLLLELMAPPAPRRAAQERVRVRLAQLMLNSADTPLASLDLVASYQADAPPLPAPVVDAAARANAARLQRRALAAAAAGDRAGAATMLQAVARRLMELGENDLAAAAMREAAALEQTGRLSGMGAKELAYATRRLGEGEV